MRFPLSCLHGTSSLFQVLLHVQLNLDFRVPNKLRHMPLFRLNDIVVPLGSQAGPRFPNTPVPWNRNGISKRNGRRHGVQKMWSVENSQRSPLQAVRQVCFLNGPSLCLDKPVCRLQYNEIVCPFSLLHSFTQCFWGFDYYFQIFSGWPLALQLAWYFRHL